MTPDLPVVEQVIVELTNAFRVKQGLGAVRRSKKLDRIAKSFARYLARSGKFSHTADGRKPAQRAAAGGYDYCQFAENLALNGDSRGFESRQLAGDAVTGWKNSPGHRRNMEAPHATEIGVGVAKAPGKQRYLSVQLFGRPRSRQFSIRIQNRAPRVVRYRLRGNAYELPQRTEVRHTLCRPGKLSFPKAGRSQSRFQISSGDLFVVRTASSGRIVVDHTPATQ